MKKILFLSIFITATLFGNWRFERGPSALHSVEGKSIDNIWEMSLTNVSNLYPEASKVVDFHLVHISSNRSDFSKFRRQRIKFRIDNSEESEIWGVDAINYFFLSSLDKNEKDFFSPDVKNLITQMKTGKILTLITSIDDKEITATFSLNNFAEAFKEFEEVVEKSR
jgi:hypothetical protein